MFNEIQCVIQEKLASRIAPTTTYSIKDADGHLLGYVKNRRLKLNFWVEGKCIRKGELVVSDGKVAPRNVKTI